VGCAVEVYRPPSQGGPASPTHTAVWEDKMVVPKDANAKELRNEKRLRELERSWSEGPIDVGKLELDK